MHDAYAAVVPQATVIDEVSQDGGGLGHRHPVQIDLGLHAEVAARQFAHRLPANVLPVKAQAGAALHVGVVWLCLQTLAQYLAFVVCAEFGSRGDPPWNRRGRIVGEWSGIGDRSAKQIGIVVRQGFGVSNFGWIFFFSHELALWCGINIEYSERHPRGQSRTAGCAGNAADSNTPADVKILVCNDDGYLATGINVLAEALEQIADVVVFAPDRNHSGASNSLTLHSPLRIHQVEENRYFVNGTPSDCVHLALSGYLDYEPDIVVSGINHGANLGDDVIYSGTVAAAMEGRFLGFPAIAVSLVSTRSGHFATAAQVAVDLVRRLQNQALPNDVILNVNVPDREYSDLAGVFGARLGFRHRSEPIIKNRDPQGKTIYWIGPAGPGQDSGPGTDFAAIDSGAVSVTPLKVDLTRHEALPQLSQWLDQ